jgi:formylglycine-generating enzyme required for sulfatase activity
MQHYKFFALAATFCPVLFLSWAAHAFFVVSKPVINSIGMEFVFLPAGSFVRKEGTFGPGIKVIISQPFYLGKYEVTQEQWTAVMGDGSNPSVFKGRTHPVDSVTWNDAQEFITRLNAREGTNRYRLPTEMEWEYAARGGSRGELFFADGKDAVTLEELGEYAWFKRNSGNKTHPVGRKKPNQYGLYDIYGNVREWVQDWYADLPVTGELTDYQGPPQGDGRVNRGGGWFSEAEYCRSGYRSFRPPDYRFNRVGFRVAFSPE